ncbi:hypothetical protein BJX62DRAFT_203545 [Aspergillus germanicus]
MLSHSVPSAGPVDKEDWVCDLQLLHHFCTVTTDTLAIREDARYTWRVMVPREGYENTYLMHGILAISALQQAQLYPAQKEHFLALSSSHQAEGLETFRTLLQNVKPENWPSMFCYASLVVYYTSALPVRLGVTDLPDPISNVVELFTVIKGIDAVLAPFIPSLRKSFLAPLAYSVWLEDPVLGNRRPPVSLLPEDTLEQINLVREFSETLDMATEEHNDYSIALSRLESAVRQINLAGPSVEAGMAYIWPFGLPKSVTTAIQEKRPLALIVLAQFCVLLHLLNNYWFLRGWGKQLLVEIGKQLSSTYAHWLEWPNRHVFG